MSCEPKPQNRGPAYLGDRRADESGDANLGRTFVCPACESCGGEVRRLATTGAGISRVLDIQSRDFVAVTCQFCKGVQFYDLPELTQANPWKWLDYCWSIAAVVFLIFGWIGWIVWLVN